MAGGPRPAAPPALLVAPGPDRLLVPAGDAAGDGDRVMLYVLATLIGVGFLVLLAFRLGLFDRPRLHYIEPGQSVFAEFSRLQSVRRRVRRPVGRLMWIAAGAAVALGAAGGLVYWLGSS